MFVQDIVNNLATIKQENGEKYLVLKKKYFPEFQHQEFYTNNPDHRPSLQEHCQPVRFNFYVKALNKAIDKEKS